jgi:glucose-1-phosphate thymidylyltransferase
MKALILSGGTGTRLRPVTYTHAKQLMPLANKPTLFYIIEKIAKCGITDVGIIVGDTREEVIRAAGSGERWNIGISYIFQQNPLGLAHAVKTAEEFLGGEDFLMALGDNAFNMELDPFIKSHYIHHANTSLLLYRAENPSQYGVAVVDGDHVVRLAEKPKETISDLIITGVYFFDRSIFKAIDATSPSARGELEITDAIQKQIETGGRVCCELLTGWWKDTGKDRDLLEANRLVLDETAGKMNP